MDLEDQYTDEHRAIFELLPWYVNGSVSESEKIFLYAHLKDCISCRNEVKHLSILNDCVKVADSHRYDEQAFDQLMSRIDQVESSVKPPLLKALFLFPKYCFEHIMHSSKPVKWVLATQLLLLLCVPIMFYTNKHDAGLVYKTLSSAPTVTSEHRKFRLVFSENAQEKNIRAALNAVSANIISGPSQKGVYTVSVETDRYSDKEVLAALRSNLSIAFAEVVQSEY